VICANVRQRCQFDRNVFDNMAEVSAFMESLHETAGTAETALVIVQSGQARN
jgi:hypothetical protein